MEGYDREFWQFSEQLRLQNNFSNLSIADSIWSNSDRRNNNNDPLVVPPPGLIGSGNKLAFGTTNHADRNNNAFDLSFNNNNKNNAFDFSFNNNKNKNKNSVDPMNNNKNAFTNDVKSYFNKRRPPTHTNNNNSGVDKRFKSLPASESLPRGEAIGGYIFVCNNDTMEENLKRQLFGLPSRYRDSVRAIRPGLPLFLYNYSTHQLHGIFEAASFGGSNIDPAAWEDKKCPGESRFPAQVRVATRKICDPLEEDAFRPILHHYDGPKFRLELSVPEALSLLDIFAEKVLPEFHKDGEDRSGRKRNKD
ncbi:hypothetical protein PR202_gb02312 [Eleusine coracana subsp. coracana]|uniref:DCD domain-containing protein n=1 Tax=Eleusine coracana subsp. coracana TaxID=191504 RepID=A0AAV5DZT5_ELECO|nr:hypothetical protein PR202_gb02312 [Eleusine coracana subsp. coracana]